MSDRKRTTRTIQPIHTEWTDLIRNNTTNSFIDKDTYTRISDEQMLRSITNDSGSLYYMFVNIL